MLVWSIKLSAGIGSELPHLHQEVDEAKVDDVHVLD